MTGVHGALYPRQTRKSADSLYVMANHGQLLEYSLDPVPDQTLTKDKICESSPIELNIVAFGQWNLGKPSGKDRTELAPPLPLTNPLLVARDLLVPSDPPYLEPENEDAWLSQVEIVTHVGPARRLWMGPQFSFRTFQHPGQSDDLAELDVTVATRPDLHTLNLFKCQGAPSLGTVVVVAHQMPVLIECGSASSFELSPRFANLSIRGSQEHIQDVENELREAMTDMAIDNNRTAQREDVFDDDRLIFYSYPGSTSSLEE